MNTDQNMGGISMEKLLDETYKVSCKKFNGYKPCKAYQTCKNCLEYEEFNKTICIIALNGLGSVLMVSSVLKPLAEKYKDSKIVFLTSEAGVPLLENNPYVSEVVGWNADNLLYLSQIKFDILINYDRSKKATAFANCIKAEQQLGFYLNDNGTIGYKGESFQYLYDLGLDDEERFHVNQKSMAQIMVESAGLNYQHDAYRIYLSEEQKKMQEEIIKEYGIQPDKAIGINTGCSPLMINRKFPTPIMKEMIQSLLEQNQEVQILLLGGKDEQEVNQELSQIDERVIDLTNTKNMRYGIVCESISKVLLSGCSFGLHLGIALEKPCVAWFGPSCEQEVELFFGGKTFKSDMKCSPCWQKQCSQEIKCNTIIPVADIVKELLSLV